ncbi:MAG: DUF1501 domain-containing protein [Gemmataceae bacterium]|nr:DUF1501 domain-containing protein [Gemmataceae bacterium]
MLPLSGRPARCCSGPSRREFLRVGGLGLPQLLHAEETGGSRPPLAKSCILIFMDGGPSHLELWDLKPDAPAEVRGEFKPIPSSVPGLTVGELLPLTSRQMHHLAQVRSVRHGVTDHNAGSYNITDGTRLARDVRGIGRTDSTAPGALAALKRPTARVAVEQRGVSHGGRAVAELGRVGERPSRWSRRPRPAGRST